MIRFKVGLCSLFACSLVKPSAISSQTPVQPEPRGLPETPSQELTRQVREGPRIGLVVSSQVMPALLAPLRSVGCKSESAAQPCLLLSSFSAQACSLWHSPSALNTLSFVHRWSVLLSAVVQHSAHGHVTSCCHDCLHSPV